MDFIEKIRQPLNLIEDDNTVADALCPKSGPENGRPGLKITVKLIVQESPDQPWLCKLMFYV